MASPKKKRRRKWVVFLLLAVVLGGMSVAALLQKREPMIAVETEKVERRDLVEKVVANGRIQPVTQVKISAEVSGEIIELPVREGQPVQKGDLLVRIKPDMYVAARQSAEAGYLSSESSKNLAAANLQKAELEFARNEKLYRNNLIAESIYVEFRTALDVAKAQLESATHQVAVAKASLARAEEELAKTAIYSPLNATVSQLNSELGERVVGTAMMTGTEIMTVADLDAMEARVDIGEIDIPLIALGQKASLEVDAFRDTEFKGTVSEIANSAKGLGAGQSQEGTKFEVRIRILDQEAFRPGMTVTCEIETRYRTNVLAVPIQSVTTRPPKKEKPTESKDTESSTTAGEVAETSEAETTPEGDAEASGETATATEDQEIGEATTVAAVDSAKSEGKRGKKETEDKPIEVVFIVEDGVAKMVPVKRGISDDDYSEIEEGLEEGQEVVKGSYRAINKELEDGKKIVRSKEREETTREP